MALKFSDTKNYKSLYRANYSIDSKKNESLNVKYVYKDKDLIPSFKVYLRTNIFINNDIFISHPS